MYLEPDDCGHGKSVTHGSQELAPLWRDRDRSSGEGENSARPRSSSELRLIAQCGSGNTTIRFVALDDSTVLKRNGDALAPFIGWHIYELGLPCFTFYRRDLNFAVSSFNSSSTF